ncbi:Cadmium, cobalt and zinc/H(+)-K(+) antiporter [Candidatus Hepatincola sp. Pdp]
MSHSHNHLFGPFHTKRANRSRMKKLFITTGTLIFVFMVIEFVGGYLSKSLALMADASHMLTDFVSVMLALVGILLSSLPPNPQKTYGYTRGEIIISLLNSVFLIFICLFIVYEAFVRFYHPQIVNPKLMLPVAIAGLIINFIVMYLFHRAESHSGGTIHHHHSHYHESTTSKSKKQKKASKNLLLESAYLHFLTDTLGSVVAIIVAITIYYTSWYIVDPILSIILVLMILHSTVKVITQSCHILMEGTPINLEAKEIEKYLEKNVAGLLDVHHIHLWSLNEEDHLISLHAVIDKNYQFDDVIENITKILKHEFHLVSITIQAESENRCLDNIN